MHTQVKLWLHQVRLIHPTFFFFKDVLECGSQNINGSPRSFFYFCQYTGLDIESAKGVDVVGRAHEYWCPGMDVVVSTEMLEHDENWNYSLNRMYDNLRPGGLLIVTCAGPNRAEHGTKRTTPQYSPFTTDYYRNISIEDFTSTLPPELWDDFRIQYARNEQDLLFYGIKKTYHHDIKKKDRGSKRGNIISAAPRWRNIQYGA